MDLNDSADLVVRFVTKDEQYAIPSVPIHVNGKSTTEELNKIIKAILTNQNGDEGVNNFVNFEFDFLIGNKLLRGSIKEFTDAERISSEVTLEVEYFAKTKPPEPHNSFLHDDWVASVDTVDKWILSGCYDGTVHIWNVATGEHKVTIPAHTGPVKAVKWTTASKSKNGQYGFISCSHDETAMVWTWGAKTNEIEHVYTYKGHARSVDCASVKSDLVATGSYDHLLKIWSLVDSDATQGENSAAKCSKLRSPVITLEGHKEAITGCAWMSSEDASDIANVATSSLDNTVRIWDVELGEVKTTLTSNRSILAVCYSPLTSLLVTASCDRHIRLWDHRQSQGSQVKSVYSSHTGWVSSVAWSVSDPNLFVSGSYDNSVKQWDARSTSAPLYDMLGHQEKVLTVNWSNANYMVSGGVDNQIKVFANN